MLKETVILMLAFILLATTDTVNSKKEKTTTPRSYGWPASWLTTTVKTNQSRFTPNISTTSTPKPTKKTTTQKLIPTLKASPTTSPPFRKFRIGISTTPSTTYKAQDGNLNATTTTIGSRNVSTTTTKKALLITTTPGPRPSSDELVLLAEHFTRDSVRECEAKHITTTINYNGLKNEWLRCLNRTEDGISRFHSQMTPHMKSPERNTKMQNTTRVISMDTWRNDTQEKFRPYCKILRSSIFECVASRDGGLGKAYSCKSDFEKDTEEFVKLVFGDLCKNDMAWMLDFLAADGSACVNSKFRALRFKKCTEGIVSDFERVYGHYLGSYLKFCETFGRFAKCGLDFMDSCDGKSGKIVQKAFKNTRKYWTAKCGACTMAAASWFVCGLGLLTIWIKNLD